MIYSGRKLGGRVMDDGQRLVRERALYTFFRTLLDPSTRALLGKIKATIAAV
jgi:hypothetical protein